MNNKIIKDIKEEKIKISVDRIENQVEIIFEGKDSKKNNTITLKGEGMLKSLIPV